MERVGACSQARLCLVSVSCGVRAEKLRHSQGRLALRFLKSQAAWGSQQPLQWAAEHVSWCRLDMQRFVVQAAGAFGSRASGLQLVELQLSRTLEVAQIMGV